MLCVATTPGDMQAACPSPSVWLFFHVWALGFVEWRGHVMWNNMRLGRCHQDRAYLLRPLQHGQTVLVASTGQSWPWPQTS